MTGSVRDFAVAVLPDSQNQLGPDVSGQASNGLPDSISRIIAERHEPELALVISVGDLVGNAECADQWTRAAAQFDRLDAVAVPYLLASGNHDDIVYHSLGTPGGGDRPPCRNADGSSNYRAEGRGTSADDEWIHSREYDRYFPVSRFASMPTFGAVMPYPNGATGPVGSGAASYQVIRAGDAELVALTLPFGPTRQQVAWAADVFAEHPHRPGILVTHDYLGDDDQLRGDRARLLGYGDNSEQCRSAVADGGPAWYLDGDTCNVEHALPGRPGGTPMPGALNGLQVYETLVAPTPSLRLVLSGHVVQHEHLDADGRPVHDVRHAGPDVVRGRRRTVRPDGSRVDALMFNAQSENGGNGWYRRLRFRPDSATVEVSTPSGTPGVAALDGPDDRFMLSDFPLV